MFFDPTRKMYYLTDEEAILIRNLLNTERVQYFNVENKTDGVYYNRIMSALDAMENPEKHKPIKEESTGPV